MNGDQRGDAIFLALALILPLSALVSRRLPMKRTLVMAGAWLGIFLVGVLIVGAGHDTFGPAFKRFTALLSDDEQHVSGGVVRLRMAPDGHFWADVSINGIQRRMLIDSGATTTSLSLVTAQAADVDVEQSPYPVEVQTANGTILARTATAQRLSLGPIVASDLRVVVAPEFGGTDVLGMNFLSRLKSWRVENQTLILQPR